MEHKEQKTPETGESSLDDLDEILEKLKAGAIGINQEKIPEETSDGAEPRPCEEPVELGEQYEMDGSPFNEESSDNSPDFEEKEPFSLKKELLSWVQVLVTAALIALFINHFIIANSQVPTGSMENTIMPGDRVIGSRLSYRFGEPERGDIAIFIFPDDEEKGIKTYYVKRIIGMPGDTVDIVDGRIYLNGADTPIEEPYLHESMDPEPPQHYEVPEDSYFMLGDNRNYSNDARRWKNHYVKRNKLVAKVLFQYFPRLRVLH